MMAQYELTVAGWVFMLGSCVTMVVWTAWCYWKVLTVPPATDDDVAQEEAEANEV